MGSRRGRYAALAALVVGGCRSAAPEGFSGGIAGDRWTFPLVGALEDGLLLVPVSIGSIGPYLFVIDPDAPVSAIDGELVKEATLRAFEGPPRLDETGTPQPRILAETVSLEIGSLIIERRDMIVVKAHTFDSAGRRIHGVIGRDVLDESLVFGFDRDQGLAMLATTKVFQPPAGATPIAFTERPMAPRTPPVPLPPPRNVVTAIVGDQTLPLHVDLGAVASQLRDSFWPDAKLVARDVTAIAVDEVGVGRRITRASEPTTVAVGSASSDRVAFVPYEDRRWADHEVAGTLGLGFFAPYDVWVRFDTRELLLRPRTPATLATRVARWETGPIAKCVNAGCVTVRVVDPLAGKPPPEGKPHPGVILSITREEKAGGMGLEVLLEAQGQPELPRLIVNLPPHVDRLIEQLDPRFLGQPLAILDASPFPRDCPSKQGCVDRLAR